MTNNKPATEEVKELRTTSLYTTCRVCEQTLGPQMMCAVFQRKGKYCWVVIGWECLPCFREAEKTKRVKNG